MGSSAKSKCPTCEAPVADAKPRPKHFPFCSERCQLADLGKWLDEEYRVAADDPPPLLDRSED